MKQDHVMMHFRPEERPFVERMIDLADRVDDRQSPALTDFLDPRQQKIAMSVVRRHADVEISLSGGIDAAERQRALIAPAYWVPEDSEFELAFLRIAVPGDYVKLSHGDYLGALVGLGMKRGKLGDLSVSDEGCDLVVARDMADFVRLHLNQVGRATVQVQEIERGQVKSVQREFQEKEFTVMSLRLDAVASDAFNLSRTKVVDPIKSGKLQLNWQTIENPATQVEEGDVISLRGHGRVRILEVGGQTKKGRTVLKVGKYI
ncbi:RNA-binding protein [Tumebacillus permanentifrigoris]|uniref:RNA-binding protein YlmH n=1 Tax=Tumebacillus permanentifrigoris TaxID=378543 RepID=A0A316D277_9BACL|nr:YlmH/Sll1252 family protein [Tumebacillus permanentifrigoris]PWK04954.1 RNA-binding protein YlmH [Tumebacillus permanentifrigoris]